MQYHSPTIDKNALVPIIVKTANREEAESYFLYSPFIKDFYTDLSALCRDIDRAEGEKGKMEGRFYPVVEGTIQGENVKMVYTDYQWGFLKYKTRKELESTSHFYRDIKPLFSTKGKRSVFRKVTSLRDSLVFIAANGDDVNLKGLETHSWEKPSNSSAIPPDKTSAFNSLPSQTVRYFQQLIWFVLPVTSPPGISFFWFALLVTDIVCNVIS